MRRQVTGLLVVGTLLSAGLAVGGDSPPMTAAGWWGQPAGRTATSSVPDQQAARGVLGPAPDRRQQESGGHRTAGRPEAGNQSQPRPLEQIGVEEVVDTVLTDRLAERATTFRYPGASYVKIHFSRLAMLPGDYVTVSDPSGRESYTYRGPSSFAESALDSVTGKGWWAMSVNGEAAVVRLHRAATGRATSERSPWEGALSGRAVAVDRVARGFTPRELAERRASERRTESVCGGDDKYDVVCYRAKYPQEYARTKPVAKMLIGGTALCTAWRVGPQNRLLTNHHCIASDSDARASEVWFNYQCVRCGGFSVERTTKVAGSRVLATNRTLDYALFSVANFEAIRGFGYLTLDQRVSARGEQVYIPQHPGGAPKQIAMASDADERGACQVEEPVYGGYAAGTDVAYRCDTEGGSSGSPIISRRTHRVIALHHFGGCPNSGVRADLLARELRRFL